MILGYARVSTAEQAADGSTSLAEQERRCRAIAVLRGADQYDFAAYVDPGVSGSVPLSERPEGARMLADARPGDAIVAVKMDRLFRSAIDALQTAESLKARGVDLILADMGVEPVTANGAAKLFFGMLALVAEFERERIEERTQDGRNAKRAAGGCVGGVPYGFRKVGEGRSARLEPVEDEQRTIALVRDLAREDPSSWRIARELARRGVLTRAGGAWHPTQVRRVLERASE